eukprot:CAMPEP_0113570582 /NCGR_PEP_ID=MMETSP0015_2-20120614/25059_1 /TAXON_ID=2838 /ORGANISM="Odontella" /LENGTH=211 /DNA_ID=CAMNT_0000473399 /DNA_START=28 /DNA_END=663 /DNA_ORIENTATION=- /assembly_acc=CAM_ASM_000160
MKLSSCFALFLILWTAEAAAPQGDKVNGNEKDRGNKVGNKGGGGQQKRAINGLLCASDGAASKECGSTDESARKRCCDGLICNNDGQCADPCGPAVRECCDIKCDGMKRLKAESVSAECCRIPLDAGTFPMIGECIKPGERFRGIMINSCDQLVVAYTGGSLGGCDSYKKNKQPICMCNAEVVVKVEATSSRTVIATGQTPNTFYAAECKP